ncbi:M50 family metallopeptidase [Deinococcus aquiradiocola]|uniref:Zinc metalloprotease n=1 Tax=Deinococcus aquiradiocola TaxID=393059 RepID=A0A917PFZ6_9DEIO|nr:RIP metalloprotease [Deinococcus aquiradiocola]GGJ75091.1 putative zinc metalloprotease [Deinococcus aquiradiocola]
MNFFQAIAQALTPQGIVWTLVIIALATFMHELAHYWGAKLQGVKVNSFSVGMGPVLARRQWRGTEWRVSLLPIGGYVEIDGMAPDTLEDGRMDSAKHGYALLPAWGKVAILLAGPVMNLLLAFLLLGGNFWANGVQSLRANRAVISSVVPDSRAQSLGFRSGDVVTAIDGQALPVQETVKGEQVGGWTRVQRALTVAGPHTFTVERAGKVQDIRFDWTPTVNGQRARLGIAYGADVKVQRVGLPGALAESGRTIVQAVPSVLKAFGNLFARFFTLNLSQDQGVVGPVGTGQVVSEAAKLGGWALVLIGATINLSLGFFNLLPIPGLDGGRILLVLVGVLRGRPLTFRQESAVTTAGFGLVMLLSLFVVVRDLSRFF